MLQRIIDQRKINANATLLEALSKMDKEHVRLLFIMDGLKVLDLISIGDIQRAILEKVDLSTNVNNIQIGKKIIADDSMSTDSIRQIMLDLRLECMPVIGSSSKELLKVVLWNDLFGDKNKSRNINLPVVIMAGGEGSRLKPLTNIIPKPLVPINEKAIVHEIMDRFSQYGCNRFFLTVNYKADLIKYYFNSMAHGFSIEFIDESMPSGTAGSLSLVKGWLDSTFFVINCDILIEEDYYALLEYHRVNKNELTVISVMKHMPIPYGVINTTTNGILESIEEKPDYLLQFNSGMYILEPHLLDEIPENTFFHITHLINKILERNGRVGVFPVSSGAWHDIGEWDELVHTYKSVGRRK